MNASNCRSCHRVVYWARTAKSGKPMPLDESVERGNVLVDGLGKAHVFAGNAAAHAAMEADFQTFGVGTTWISHHAEGQCPQGREWQGKRRGDADAPAAAPEPAQGSLL